MHTSLAALLLVAVIAAFLSCSTQAQEGPIQMNRRDISPFGEILSELKGKALGGRMRFGKRSQPMGGYRIVPDTYDPRDAY